MKKIESFSIKDLNVVVKRNGYDKEQIEIRDGLGLVIIVCLGEGYEYRSYGKRRYYWEDEDAALEAVKGINIHMAMNGPLQCTFTHLDYLHDLITACEDRLMTGRWPSGRISHYMGMNESTGSDAR